MRHPTGSFIPLPTEQHVPPGAAPFVLTSASRILSTDAASSVATYLASVLRRSTGFTLSIETALDARPVLDDKDAGHDITLHLDLDDIAGVGAEGYHLETSERGTVITATTNAGLFYGVQSLRQLFPPDLEEHSVRSAAWEAVATSITDRPRFAYRGAMLDVARHFFDVAEVCAFLDRIALFKINALHLHLTDDQGWRISIEGRPELTAIGGATQVDGGPGGFYTREDFARIVEHAAARFITIVPEIDMPGHTNAALAALPELNASGTAPEPYVGTEVGFSSLDTRSDATWDFLDDVIRDVAAQSPGPWLHFGGDESHATDPNDYREFVGRASRLVANHGKVPIAWHEAGISSNLAPGTIGQYWSYRTPQNDSADRALSFVQQGGTLILSPADVAYLDMTYDNSSPIGLSWADGSTSVQESYEWEPTTVLPDAASAILGIEAPLWTETVRSRADIDYLVFPRLTALAEIAWSVAPDVSERRTWEDFSARLDVFAPRFSGLSIRPGGPADE